MKWTTDVYLIKMELNKTLKTEDDIKKYYENRVRQMDKCVRRELGKRSHGQKYKYTKTDYNEFSYANFCDKDEENMDCSDLFNGTNPFTGNKSGETLSVKRKLYLKRLNIRRRKDEKGIYRNYLVFFPNAVYGLKGDECGKIIESCSKNFDQLTINQMAAVLCYWSTGIVPFTVDF
ncbi:MAG: hypothetical protein ACRCUS_04840 [Anaerovoracaceae bacterium]